MSVKEGYQKGIFLKGYVHMRTRARARVGTCTNTLTHTHTHWPSSGLHLWLLPYFALNPWLKARTSHSHTKSGNSLCRSPEFPVT